MNLRILLENYHKIVLTTLNHSSHHVKPTDFKIVKILTEKLKNIYKLEKVTFIANISYNPFPFRLTTGMVSLETVYADISITFSQKFDNFLFLYLLCLHHSFHKHMQCLFVSKSNSVLATKQILIRTLLGSQGADYTWYHISGCLENILHWVINQFMKVVLYGLMKRMLQANIKR